MGGALAAIRAPTKMALTSDGASFGTSEVQGVRAYRRAGIFVPTLTTL
jgi:hypothetical protein